MSGAFWWMFKLFHGVTGVIKISFCIACTYILHSICGPVSHKCVVVKIIYVYIYIYIHIYIILNIEM